jgi:serine/threonine protein kinase
MKVMTLPRSGVLAREHALLSRAQHSNVLRSYEHGHLHNDAEYLVLELVPGADLAAWLGSLGRLTSRRALSVLWQLASAVDHLHAKGIVHSDIKPANIMLNVHGDHVTLIDFGVAFELATEHTQRGSTGTPGYMAPEQLRGEGCGTATDRYAVAAVALELLGASLAMVAARKRSRKQSAPSEVPLLGSATRTVFRRALHTRPEKRYASARAFVTALTRAINLDASAETLVALSPRLSSTRASSKPARAHRQPRRARVSQLPAAEASRAS